MRLPRPVDGSTTLQTDATPMHTSALRRCSMGSSVRETLATPRRAFSTRLAAEERQRVRSVFGDPEQRFQPIAERLVAAVVQAHDAELVGRGHARRRTCARSSESAACCRGRRRCRRAAARSIAAATPAAGDVAPTASNVFSSTALPVLFDLKVLLLQARHRAVVVIQHDDVQFDQVLRLLLRRDDRRRRSHPARAPRPRPAGASEPHHLHDHALLAPAVELGVEHLFPRARDRARRP